jgi:hypothetical protein
MSIATVPVVTIVKKSLGWSIALSVLMILVGFLDIVVPPGRRNCSNCLCGLAARF